MMMMQIRRHSVRGAQVAISLCLTILLSTPHPSLAQQPCGWCGAQDAPATLTTTTTIAPASEPGPRMVISGTIYEADGKTPAAGVIVYTYHTNREGVYPKRGDESGNGRIHGYLRGWMKTDASGRYEYRTIRPAPYQTHGGEPAHVHMTLFREDFGEYWINATWFADDVRVTKALVAGLKRQGGFSNVIPLKRGADGTWRGSRNIILNALVSLTLLRPYLRIGVLRQTGARAARPARSGRSTSAKTGR